MRLFLLSLVFLVGCQNPTTNPVTSPRPPDVVHPDRFNLPGQTQKAVVLMISIDGFRSDYIEKYEPPTLIAWAHEGVRAEAMIPSFPTLTFPNHVTLVTGLRPGHHGIVNNKFYDEKRKEFYSIGNIASVNDGSWYRGTPLWTLAEKEGMLSATCFWVGSEAKIGGIDPTYLKPYDAKISNEQRVKWVTEWLSLPENKKPHFIGLYFSDVDTAGHKFGPDSDEVKQAILDIDTQLGKLRKFISEQNLDIQIIVVSDHGMKTIDSTFELPVESLKKFQSTGRGPVVSFYSDDENEIQKTYEEIKKIKGPFQVYKAADYPSRWKLDDPDRKGDIMVVGNPGVYITFADGKTPPPTATPPTTSPPVTTSNRAGHGWDTTNTTEMNALFIASGSKFRKGLRIPAFDNIHVYPLVKQILELKTPVKVDGDPKVLLPILASH